MVLKEIQYNFLSEVLEEPPKSETLLWLARLGFIGFAASVVSDTISNSMRVVKTFRQVNDTKISYCESKPLDLLFVSVQVLFTHSC